MDIVCKRDLQNDEDRKARCMECEIARESVKFF